MLNAAIIGFGGVAQSVHVPAYETLEAMGKVRLVAACDIDPGQFHKKLEINIASSGERLVDPHFYTDLEEMLAKERLDLIDICLPTYLHARYAIDMLGRGYHVQCEKPMARSSKECAQMLAAATAAKGRLAIGQCLRFSGAYLFLKDAVDANTFGRPVSAIFRRISAPPIWAWDNWFMDCARSGGCLLDMHIHDVDVARFIFGDPIAASCVTRDVYSGDDIAHTRLIYDGPSVLAIGDWSQHGVDFSADYRVAFETATVIYEDGAVTVYPRDGEAWTPALPAADMYMKELEYLADIAVSGAPNTKNSPESAAKTIALYETLKASADKNGELIIHAT